MKWKWAWVCLGAVTVVLAAARGMAMEKTALLGWCSGNEKPVAPEWDAFASVRPTSKPFGIGLEKMGRARDGRRACLFG